jgi:hypothetical protein
MRTHLNLFSKPPRLNFFSRPPRPPVVGDIAGQPGCHDCCSGRAAICIGDFAG